ncbi:MAG: portal protein [Alphaproteobacteria bacterium]
MALPPQMVDMAMGPGGPADLMPEEMQVELPGFEDELPPGIEIVGEEQMVEVQAEEYDHNANLAEVLDDATLGEISSDLRAKIKEDLESRDEWEEAISKGLGLLGINYEERNEPFLGASGVHHPLLSEAVTQFQAQSYKEMLPSGGPVKTQVLGTPTRETEEQAQRIEDFMNYQITEVMEEFDPDTDQMLYYLPLTGSTFKKVYFDQTKQRAVSKFVPAEDLVVPYTASDLRTAERVTHVFRMTENEVRKLQVAGVYKDVNISPIDESEDEGKIHTRANELTGIRPNYGDDVYTLYEIHVDLDLEGFEDLDMQGDPTGIRLPYIVTIDEGSGEILSLVRSYRETDPLKRRRQYFTHYKFLPGFGFYGFGLLHTIGGLSRAATSILRQLIDAGTLSNLPAGFKARGVRIRNDDEPLSPGEFRDIDAPGGDLKNSIIPLPYKEPSGTLAQLLGVIVDSGRRFAQVADSKVADVNSQAPVGTTVALIEQGSKVISSIHKRLHYAQKQEFRMLAEIFADNPMPYPYFVGQNVPPEIMQQDFDGRIDILPVSDPNIFSMSQRLSLAQTQLQLAQAAPQMHNQYEAYRRMYDALDIKNIDAILPPPQPPQPMDPAAENSAALKGLPSQAFPQQDHRAHIRVHAALIQSPAIQANPQAFLLLQAHIQDHVGLFARDIVQEVFKNAMQQAQAIGEPVPQIDPNVVEAMVAQQTADTLEQLAPLLQSASQQDPLVEIRQKELENDQIEIQRKMQNDVMNFEIDQAKLQQAADLAMQRMRIQQGIADDRNDVNIYRINTQASLARNRGQ